MLGKSLITHDNMAHPRIERLQIHGGVYYAARNPYAIFGQTHISICRDFCLSRGSPAIYDGIRQVSHLADDIVVIVVTLLNFIMLSMVFLNIWTL